MGRASSPIGCAPSARLLGFAATAILVAATVLGAVGCGGGGSDPASDRAAAPTRHFSEVGTSADVSVIPADATVPATSELQQALTELQKQISQAQQADPWLQARAKELEVQALQNRAVDMRKLAEFQLQAGLVSGALQMSTGALSLVGSAVTARLPAVEQTVLQDKTSATADELKARFDALKKSLGETVTSNNTAPDVNIIPTDATVPVTADLRTAVDELQTKVNAAGPSVAASAMALHVKVLALDARYFPTVKMRKVAEVRLQAGAVSGQLDSASGVLGTIGSAVIAGLPDVEERVLAGDSSSTAAEIRARFDALKKSLAAP